MIAAILDRRFETPEAAREADALGAAAPLPRLLEATVETARAMARSIGAPNDPEFEDPALWRHALSAAASAVAAHWRATGHAGVPPGLGEMAAASVSFADLQEFQAAVGPQDEADDLLRLAADDAAARAALMVPCAEVHALSQRFAFWLPPEAYAAVAIAELRSMAIKATARLAGDDASDASRLALFRTMIQAATAAWVASHGARTRAVTAELRTLDAAGKERLKEEFSTGRREPGVLDDCRRQVALLAGEASRVSLRDLLPLIGGGRPSP